MFHKQTTCDALVNRTLVVNIGYFRHNVVVQTCVDIAPLENKNEVDFVLERRKKVVGIEIKAARTVLPRDFAGLRVLKEMCGEDFVCGMILYRGDQVEKTQGNLFAVPLGKLLNNEFLMGK